MMVKFPFHSINICNLWAAQKYDLFAVFRLHHISFINFVNVSFFFWKDMFFFQVLGNLPFLSFPFTQHLMMKNKNEKENMIPIILLHQEKYQLSVTHESLIITTAQQNFKNYFVITDHRGINKLLINFCYWCAFKWNCTESWAVPDWFFASPCLI